MKRRTKIILTIILVIIVGVGIYGYQVYQMIMGSEKIRGTQESIPEAVNNNIPGLNLGADDWP
ncbi:MAG: hypothetical protein CVU00_15580, partial [Bacteroidetes bacterium HGW-Bacteroidetes-17]